MMKARRPLAALVLALAGCAPRPPVTVAEAPPPVEVAPRPPLPAGATPGMLVPEPLADGSFPTPNQGLAGVAAIWHLRAGLNVAALSCPGDDGAAVRAAYNAWLKRAKATLAKAQKGYAASYPKALGVGGYDDAMTRLYNYFSQTPVRSGFCAAAAGVAAELASPAAAGLPAFATSRLVVLDRPFTDFYQAYDAWRVGKSTRVVIASAAIAPPAPVAATGPIALVTRARPGALTLDLAGLPADTQVTAAH